MGSVLWLYCTMEFKDHDLYEKKSTLNRLLNYLFFSSMLMHSNNATLSPLYVAFLHHLMFLYAFSRQY